MDKKIIDGSVLEGGGQLIRSSVALSCLMQQPIEIINIRGKRSNPGLQPQHLAGIDLVKKMCNATTMGDQKTSCKLSFEPQSLRFGSYDFEIDPRTAASIPLMIQSVLPVALFSHRKSVIHINGGTDVNFAPSIDYVINVLFPMYRKLFGISCEVVINRRGFYPKGGGNVKLTVCPVVFNGYLKPIKLIDFNLNVPFIIRGYVFMSGRTKPETASIANEMKMLIINVLRVAYPANILIRSSLGESNVFAGSIVLAADIGKCLIGSSVIYDKKKTVRETVSKVCDKFVLDLKAKSCVDANTMDNLIIFMALAKGKSRVKCREITLHTRTAIHIAKMLTNAKFKIKKTEDGLNEVICLGIGHKRHM